MALGTAPQRLLTLFETEWEATRAGRGDVPPMYDPDTPVNQQTDVVVPVRDRQTTPAKRGIHDILHIYHPEANPPASTDRGFKEENLVESVQIDVELTDRTDQSTGERLSAEERMVGRRGDLAAFDAPPYPGVLGEVKYVLEGVRRGLDEWDRVSHDFQNLYLGNSNADVAVSVELEQIAKNTV